MKTIKLVLKFRGFISNPAIKMPVHTHNDVDVDIGKFYILSSVRWLLYCAICVILIVCIKEINVYYTFYKNAIFLIPVKKREDCHGDSFNKLFLKIISRQYSYNFK